MPLIESAGGKVARSVSRKTGFEVAAAGPCATVPGQFRRSTCCERCRLLDVAERGPTGVRPVTRWLLLAVAAGALFAADPTLKVNEADARKAATAKTVPDYPPIARQLKLLGRIELEAIVADDGKVETVRPVKGNPVLTQAGVEALKKWKFTPFQEDGKPARAVISISFEFNDATRGR